MVYEVRFTKAAKKDVNKLTQNFKKKLKKILQERISINPDEGKQLVGDLAGFYSIRLTYRDRVLYTIDAEDQIIYIHRTKTHYGE